MNLLRNIFIANFKNKVTALVLAVVIWFLVNTQISIEENRKIEVRVEKQGSSDVSIEVVPDQVEVRFHGPKRAIEEHVFRHGKKFSIPIDVKPGKDEKVPFLLTKKYIKELPPEIKIMGIKPNTVTVRITHEITRPLNVVADLHGEPLSGFRIKSVACDPSTVDVRGARKALEHATIVLTQPIDVTGKSESLSKTLFISGIIDNEAMYCGTPIKVAVTIESKPKRMEVELPVYLLMPSDFEYLIKLEKPREKVILEGPASVMDGLIPEDLTLMVRIPEKPKTETSNRGEGRLSGAASADVHLVGEVFVKYTAEKKALKGKQD